MKGNETGAIAEYRIFKSLKCLNDEDYYKNELSLYLQNNSDIEKRIDFYIFPLDLKFDNAFKYGIKFRDAKFKKNLKAQLIELKTRLSHNDGREFWIKPISSKIKKISLLTRISKDDCIDNGYYVEIDQSIYIVNINQIHDCIKEHITLSTKDEQLIKCLKLPYGFGITHKNRTKNYIEDAIFKLTTFKVEKDKREIIKSRNYYLRSFCVEGLISEKDIDYINKKKDKNDFLGGYPEAIQQLMID